MLKNSLSLTERNKAIDKTVANAWELKVLLKNYYTNASENIQRPKNIKALAIIQGYDTHSIKYCARRLLELGFDFFGIGSMAHLYRSDEITKRVEVVQAVVGPKIHVFGVSAIETLKLLTQMGVDSVDSSRPMKAAIYNEIIYSEPYRRFGIRGSRFKTGNNKFSPSKLMSKLDFYCPCPVCEGKTNADILKIGTRKHLKLRAIHNYYHIKRMIAPN